MPLEWWWMSINDLELNQGGKQDNNMWLQFSSILINYKYFPIWTNFTTGSLPGVNSEVLPHKISNQNPRNVLLREFFRKIGSSMMYACNRGSIVTCYQSNWCHAWHFVYVCSILSTLVWRRLTYWKWPWHTWGNPKTDNQVLKFAFENKSICPFIWK